MTDKQEQTPHRAVALEYQDAQALPRVLVSGIGEVADEIIKVARESGVPVREDDDLSALLMKIKPDQFINPETFQLAAQVLSFLYHADKEWRSKHQFLKPVLE